MLVLPNSTAYFAKKEAGGKGYNLYLMSQQSLPVPDWVVLGKSAFRQFLAETNIAKDIDSCLQQFLNKQLTDAETAQQIESIIESKSIPSKIKDQIAFGYNKLTGADKSTSQLIAVRSSAAEEDGGSHSFAGQLSSFLYVDSLDAVYTHVRRCWASAFSARCLSYKLSNSLDLHTANVAVVLQLMIDPESSGVAFSCDPIENDTNTYVISSVYGVGEGLVSGALEGDTFWLDKLSGEVKNQEIVTKEQAFHQTAKTGCGPKAVAEDKQTQPSLDASQLKALHSLVDQIDNYYKDPQDIEWALKDGKFYLLQSRPVTTLSVRHRGFPNLWDNSNIVESYGGLTLPLSFTFALRNYKNVYIQFCEILGLSRRVVQDMEDYLGNMLGCINGRVYYNLYNWYKLVGVLPGFSNNKQFMETMMGVGEALGDNLDERIKPHPSWFTLKGRLLKVRTGIAFLNYHFTIQKMVDTFLSEFNDSYERFRRIDYSRLPSDEIFAHYLTMEKEMLGRWKAPIINDFLCMVHFGLLKKLTNLWLTEIDPNIQNDLLIGEGNIESAEPTKALMAMAKYAKKDDELTKLIVETEAEDLLEALHQSSFQDFYRQVTAYIDRFGFRCMNEMKLEEKDLLIDPTFLFVCLKNYLNLALDTEQGKELEIRRKAEQQVDSHLKGWRHKLYRWSLFHARKALRNRENTRFARTRAYGVARSMFNAMGSDLVNQGVITEADDIFYLNLEEVFGIHQGTLSTYNLKSFVTLRKQEYQNFENAEPKIRFLTKGPVYWKNNYIAEEELPDVEADASYHLKGTPCCPGIVEGIVKVIESVQDGLNLNGEILVTKRTDPGWVPLYPSMSGLLIERGSLLSHSAIVAREMGLPAIVNIKGLMPTLKTGMKVRIDGVKGTVTILEEAG